MSMPVIVHVEEMKSVYPLCWHLKTDKKKWITVVYRNGELICRHRDTQKCFYTKKTKFQDKTQISMYDMLEATGFKCGSRKQ
jgi:hypothetical protein